MSDDILRTSLLDLLHAMGDDAKGILLGGGYGLYLKQLRLAEAGQRTVMPSSLWPAPRATQDLDLLLSTELVADVVLMQRLRSALDRQGYTVVPGSEYLQFSRPFGASRVVKVDLLTAQLDVLKTLPSIHADDRRARPNAEDHPKLHAHPTDGALMLADSSLFIDIDGVLSSQRPYTTRIAIPHPFSYLLMKLTAFRDRRNDPNKDLGRHHAMDIFRIIAMLTESDYEQAREYAKRLSSNPQVQSCADLIRSDFSSNTAPGVIAMRQHPLWPNNELIPEFIEILSKIIL